MADLPRHAAKTIDASTTDTISDPYVVESPVSTARTPDSYVTVDYNLVANPASELVDPLNNSTLGELTYGKDTAVRQLATELNSELAKPKYQPFEFWDKSLSGGGVRYAVLNPLYALAFSTGSAVGNKLGESLPESTAMWAQPLIRLGGGFSATGVYAGGRWLFNRFHPKVIDKAIGRTARSAYRVAPKAARVLKNLTPRASKFITGFPGQLISEVIDSWGALPKSYAMQYTDSVVPQNPEELYNNEGRDQRLADSARTLASFIPGVNLLAGNAYGLGPILRKYIHKYTVPNYSELSDIYGNDRNIYEDNALIWRHNHETANSVVNQPAAGLFEAMPEAVGLTNGMSVAPSVDATLTAMPLATLSEEQQHIFINHPGVTQQRAVDLAKAFDSGEMVFSQRLTSAERQYLASYASARRASNKLYGTADRRMHPLAHRVLFQSDLAAKLLNESAVPLNSEDYEALVYSSINKYRQELRAKGLNAAQITTELEQKLPGIYQQVYGVKYRKPTRLEVAAAIKQQAKNFAAKHDMPYEVALLALEAGVVSADYGINRRWSSSIAPIQRLGGRWRDIPEGSPLADYKSLFGNNR